MLHRTPARDAADLGSLGRVVLAIHRVSSCNDAAASIKTGVDASFGDGNRLLLHNLNGKINYIDSFCTRLLRG